MEAIKKYRPLPHRDNNDCFACGPDNESGLKMKFVTDDKSLFSWVIVPPHLCGWNHLVHGGIVATILDEIMSWTALHLLDKIILTKSIQIDFKKPIYVDRQVKAEGKILRKTSDREALLEGSIYNDQDELCARSKGTFALFTLEAMRKKKILDERIIKDIETGVKSVRN